MTGWADDKLRATSAYSVRGETQIMQELVDNGPLYVAFTVYDDFPTYRSGVYKHTSKKRLGGHAVTLVGYGDLDGEKYWKVKNSWNEQWGDGGHFLILRGKNECGIEGSVVGGTIVAPPSPVPTPPVPPTPPAPPTPTTKHHYGSPPCLDDEVEGDLSGKKLCAPLCDGGCPSDVDPSCSDARPQCILNDQDTGKKLCALTCGQSGGTCPSGAVCSYTTSPLLGVCAFPGDDEAPLSRKFFIRPDVIV